jgi:starvation-inducible DNA-binding protein
MAAASDLIELLNTHLATHIDLHMQLKQAHWNVRGPSFIGLHKLFDKAAGEVEGYYDTIAERAAALGGEACGTLDDVASETLLKPYMLGIASQMAHVRRVMESLTIACDAGEKAIKTCLAAQDQATADVFIEIVRGLDGLKYLIGSHIETTPRVQQETAKPN